jgi:hypothetical protein
LKELAKTLVETAWKIFIAEKLLRQGNGEPGDNL